MKFNRATGTIQLPAGTTLLHEPLKISADAHKLTVRGDPSGSTLKLTPDFKGTAALVVNGGSEITLSNFRIEGNRSELKSAQYLPPSDVSFANYFIRNGVLIQNAKGVVIRSLSIRSVSDFPILITHSSDVSVEKVDIQDSGSLNGKGHSNTSGGILMEEGTTHFTVRHCTIHNICGNGIWTHSNYTSPRNSDGAIEDNAIWDTPRDAIQIGHALRVRVAGNRGGRIGSPVNEADLPGGATPVAIDTAGNVEDSVYAGNHFEDVDGECIDLDGFHDGRIEDNSCVNWKPAGYYPLSHFGILFGNSNPDMTPQRITVTGNVIQGFAYGGIYVIGSDNEITGNRFVNNNTAGCTGKMTSAKCNYAPQEPGMLRSGIYLGRGAARPAPAHRNIIRNNFITGFGNARWCIETAPGIDVSANHIDHNRCVPSH